MRNREYFKNKKVVIIGLARSGLACANLLCDLGAQVSISDNRDNDATRGFASQLKSREIKIELGKHSRRLLEKKDLVIVSPGVTSDAEPVKWAEQLKIPVISEIEFSWILCPGKVIAVTGSCGKTTVSTLIAEILKAKKEKVFLCGNIGNPFAGEVEKIGPDDYVSLEVSSFQLEKIDKFKPVIAVILNFTRNHLDRHKDMQEYLKAKKRIFMNQGQFDFTVLNYRDPLVRELSKETKAGVVYFSQSDKLNPNLSCLLSVASILGIEKSLVDKIWGNFSGLKHRMEYVDKINNVSFINDSKATTADSTLWALKTIDSPIILIAGGKDKGVDYSLIGDLASEKVKGLVLIGQAAGRIEKTFKKSLPVDKAATLEEAVIKAFNKAKSGDCVLLSPMCSSFDMFSGYEERGEVFKNAVERLKRHSS